MLIFLHADRSQFPSFLPQIGAVSQRSAGWAKSKGRCQKWQGRLSHVALLHCNVSRRAHTARIVHLTVIESNTWWHKFDAAAVRQPQQKESGTRSGIKGKGSIPSSPAGQRRISECRAGWNLKKSVAEGQQCHVWNGHSREDWYVWI